MYKTLRDFARPYTHLAENIARVFQTNVLRDLLENINGAEEIRSLLFAETGQTTVKTGPQVDEAVLIRVPNTTKERVAAFHCLFGSIAICSMGR